MIKDKSEKAFLKLLFDRFGSDENYIEIVQYFVNIRRSMCSNHKSFKNFGVRLQLEYCVTISLIVVHSRLQYINENRPLSFPEKKIYQYSVEKSTSDVDFLIDISVNYDLNPKK